MINANDSIPVSQRVVEKVATATDTDPLELEPLYHQIDPECLDGLFDGDRSAPGRSGGRVEFRMAGCEVAVRADGSIDVTPSSGSAGRVASEDHTAASGAAESPD